MAMAPCAAVRTVGPKVASTVGETGGTVTDPCPQQMNGSESRMQDLERTDQLPYIGIDISKSHLDVHIAPNGECFSVLNSKQGLHQLVKRLKKINPVLIVFEATGKYHRPLHHALNRARLACSMINPRQARHFAGALGQLAKTDAIDARMLALYAMQLEPATNAPASQAIENLKELVATRRSCVAERTALSNRLGETCHAGVRTMLRRQLRQLEKDIKRIELWIADLIRADEALAARYDILLSVPGMGPVSATTCLAEMGELGTCSDKQVAALAGLAPVARESGNWAGKRRIRGGRKPVRDCLYMAALAAARSNPGFRAFYQRLAAKGKPHKVALTAVMRKLIVLANTLIRENRHFLPVAP